jgi:SH3-like domain-containing protein
MCSKHLRRLQPEQLPTMRYWTLRAGLAALLVGLVSCHGAPVAAQSQASAALQGTGLPVPRFVSLKSDRVHIRQGPGTEYKVVWVFQRIGLPVEVLGEFEGWRQVRDSEGATGWVLQALVSGRRTALVLPWEIKSGERPVQVPLRGSDRESASPIVLLEAGVIANIRSCDGSWCYVSVGEYRGYIEQKKLWGVYAEEVIR